MYPTSGSNAAYGYPQGGQGGPRSPSMQSIGSPTPSARANAYPYVQQQYGPASAMLHQHRPSPPPVIPLSPPLLHPQQQQHASPLAPHYHRTYADGGGLPHGGGGGGYPPLALDPNRAMDPYAGLRQGGDPNIAYRQRDFELSDRMPPHGRYEHAAPPQDAFAPYATAYGGAAHKEEDDSVDPDDDDDDADVWNDPMNSITVKTMFRVSGRLSELKNTVQGGVNNYIVREMSAEARTGLFAQIERVRGKIVKQKDAPQNAVTITEIKVVGQRNQLYHGVAIDLSHVIPASGGHFEAASGRNFLHIIPSESENCVMDIPAVYNANRDVYSKLASKYGGINPNTLDDQIADLLPASGAVMVKHDSKIVRAARDTLRKINNPNLSPRERADCIDPNLQTDSVMAEQFGYCSISRKFYDMFVAQLEEQILKRTTPVNLSELTIHLHHAGGESFGSIVGTRYENTPISETGEGIEQWLDKQFYEIWVDLIITFIVRHDS